MEPRPREDEVRNLWQAVRRAFVAGATIMLPVLITLVVLQFVIGFLSGLLAPVVVVLQQYPGIESGSPTLVTELIALLVLAALFVLVGFIAESEYGRGRMEPRLERAIEGIPGLGSIYSSINEISDMLLESDTESFREVKVIEYPSEGSYTLAFLTSERAAAVSDATGEGKMVTLFMPMAPNPMGGFLIHLPADRVYDVDLTVEEGIQAVLSTGVTLEGPEEKQG